MEGQSEEQTILRTSRLILKRGTLPKWAPRGILQNTESWVLEETEVELDPLTTDKVVEDRKGKGREMKSWTRNLDHTTVMAVTELNTFRERLHRSNVPSSSKERSGTATVGLRSRFEVTSSVSLGLLRTRIEKFGLNRVLTHIDSSRNGILLTHTRFLEQRLGVLSGEASLGPQSGAMTTSKRSRLVTALRPPFLDGDFEGPIARLKIRLLGVRHWWRNLDRGGVGNKGSIRGATDQQGQAIETEDGNLTHAERLRKRLLYLRDQSKYAFRRQEVVEENDDD
ncbi:hypothetical protein CBS101457_002502 [Exobasidium rhododendri]|nr:hypothetical protein CBS101457_002502 [Exobasidium rhododendri]